MSRLLEIHQVVAFLVLLCGIIFSWNTMGRRVVNAVVALQVLLGIAVAAVLGMSHEVIPPLTWLHLLVAVAIMGCYGMAMRAGKQAGGSKRALALSIAGVVLILANVYLGLHMAGML